MNAMMREVAHSDFTEFLKEHKESIVKPSRMNMGRKKKIGNYQPEQFELERTNAWSLRKGAGGRLIKETIAGTGLLRWHEMSS